MKILWFTETSTFYDHYENSYYGCGWTESLQLLLEKEEEIELSIAFFHDSDRDKSKRNNVTYYPIRRVANKYNPLKKLFNNWNGNVAVNGLKTDIDKILYDSKPDIVHVFGTEGVFSELNKYTSLPVVYHIQGLINPYLNTYLPINQSKFSFYFNINYLANHIKGNSPVFDLKRFTNQAKREAEVLKTAKYVMGRTEWDKNTVKIFNPAVSYFHVDEVLREAFYEANSSRKNENGNVLRIVSTLSPTIYKGIDVVLKTAKALKEFTDINFQWEIIGLDSTEKLFKHFEKTENINHTDVNIICVGKIRPNQLVECLQVADVYVHPSYIDNSPNSVCEAQMIGLPVIACNVGGVSTLVQHEVTGFLVPSNGVFELVHYLSVLNDSENLRKKIGQQASQIAAERHNQGRILADLLEIYFKLRNYKSLSSDKKLKTE